nr:hypothetical protein [Natronorubrum halalkaliphilum]
MHFVQRTQQALRDVGLETDDLRGASATAAETNGATLEELFATNDRVRFAPERRILQ